MFSAAVIEKYLAKMGHLNPKEVVRQHSGEIVEDGHWGKHVISTKNIVVCHNDKDYDVEVSVSPNGSKQLGGYFKLHPGSSDEWYRDRTKPCEVKLKRGGQVYKTVSIVFSASSYSLSQLETL